MTLADRELVEQDSDVILKDAKEKNIVLLVVGDPLGCVCVCVCRGSGCVGGRYWFKLAWHDYYLMKCSDKPKWTSQISWELGLPDKIEGYL